VAGAVPDDHVVVQPDPEQPGALDELPRELDILLRRGRLAGGVIVDQN
jgi:hypothetical protein